MICCFVVDAVRARHIIVKWLYACIQLSLDLARLLRLGNARASSNECCFLIPDLVKHFLVGRILGSSKLARLAHVSKVVGLYQDASCIQWPALIKGGNRATMRFRF